MANLVFLRCSNVPQYLRDSEFYRNLDGNDDEEFSLTEDHFKADTSVSHDNDVDRLLSTLQFWGSASFPESIIDFLMQPGNVLTDSMIEKHGEYFPILKTIRIIRSLKPNQYLNEAIEYANLELVEYLHKRGSAFDATSSILAAKNGSVPILKYMHEHGHAASSDATKAAASMGHLHCLQYLHSMNCPWHKEVGLMAAINGHSLCLQFVTENGHHPLYKLAMIKQAARNGHHECLQYLIESMNIELDENLVHWAVDSGNVQCVKVAFNHIQQWPIGVEHTIIHTKNFDCFVYSVAKGCRYNASHMCTIAELGLLQHLQYIQPYHPALFSEFTMRSALSHKQLSCVKFLHECGCEWSPDATAMAIQRNDYDCLVYMCEHGAAFGSNDCTLAARHGHLPCLQYLHIHAAASRGKLECLVYLHENGCPWDVSTALEALENNHIECFNYTKLHGCPLPPYSTRLSKWLGW